MAISKSLKGLIIGFIIAIALISIGISLLWIDVPRISYSLIFTGITILTFIFPFCCILSLRELLTEKTIDAEKERLELIVLINAKKNNEQEGILKTENFTYNLEVITNLPNNTICMISRLDLSEKKDILQCQACMNYFLANYLLDWLETNNYCPVCRKKIRYKNK